MTISRTDPFSNSTEFVVNPNSNLPEVLMSIQNGVTTYYVYGPGLLYQVIETPTETNTLTYHYDYRGSTIALTDGNGNVTDRMEYSLYGTLTYHLGTNSTPFQFNGRFGVQADPNGLLYMRARYYNPYISRFINADPSGFNGGLNFYLFCNDNPINAEDPFGLWTWTQTVGLLQGVGGGLQALTGYTLATGSAAFGAAASWTGVGLVAGAAGTAGGIAIGAHGLDQAIAGFSQAFSGNQTQTFTSQDLQALGMSQNAANLTDAGISVVGSLGAGFATAPLRVATLQLTDPLATEGLSFSDILSYNEMGSQALNGADFEALGGGETSSLFKAPYINDGIDLNGNPLTTQWYQSSGLNLILTGNTPYANMASGVLGAGLGTAQLGNSSTGK